MSVNNDNRPLQEKDLGFIVQTTADAVLGAICQALGVENLGELRLKLEGAGNEIPQTVSREVEAALRNPAMAAVTVDGIIANVDAANRLQYELYKLGNKARRSADDRRAETVKQSVIGFYAVRNPDSILKDEDVAGVVGNILESGILRGKIVSDGIIRTWIEGEEEKMRNVIRNLAYARTSDDDVAAYARMLVLEGIRPDPEVVQARLSKEDIQLKKG